MALIEYKDYPSTDTPISSENLNFNFKEVLNLLCPVGKVELFFDSDDHSNYLGFKWVLDFKEETPVGYNPESKDDRFKTVGNNFGKKEHSHGLNGTGFARIGLNSYNFIVNETNEIDSANEYYYNSYAPVDRTYGTGSTNCVTTLSGSTNNEDSYQPSKTVAFWRRIE